MALEHNIVSSINVVSIAVGGNVTINATAIAIGNSSANMVLSVSGINVNGTPNFGPQGPNGPQGPQGSMGSQGPTGAQGPQGTSGVSTSNVTLTGNTTLSNTVFTGSITNGIPLVKMNITSANSATFNWSDTIIANTLTSNAHVISLIGQDLSNKNSAYYGFRYDSAGSNNNIMTLGLYGVDDVLNINGQGRVGIGNTVPEEKLHVTGAIKAGTKAQNGAYEPAISLSSPGQGFGNAAVFLNNTTNEGDAIIYADFEPYVEWNLAHRNSTNEFIMHSGSSTGNIDSSTFYNRAGSARTGYSKFKFGLTDGVLTVGNTMFVNGQPGFLAYPSTSYNVTTGTITYDAERFDTASNYNTSTYTFTAPVAGRYMFGFSFWAPPSSVAMCKLQINGADWNGMPYPRAKAYDASHYVYMSASVVVNLSANDTAKVVYTEGTVHINTIYNYFYGYLLG